ncbi:MAG: glycoside hydrolase family 97 protein [Alphaproteobacteria bacterium]|nr:glycoside hydrolase family 97 protein [Alphaproteobacteria bacterium]MBU0865956.1 glycoside hydrolase family 97 protein [Alphaproteobacteria bacterium]MBU1825221.1 glycoside hydrolase family 97 protein [Alphaproteobacteria bacterium]
MRDRDLVRVGSVLLAALVASPAAARDDVTHELCSPDTRTCFSLTTVGEIPTYRVTRDGKPVIAPSRLGFMLRGHGKFEHATALGKASFSEADERWEQPWGENRWVRDHYREMRVPITELIGGKRRIDLIARVFDHGVGFRFAFPDQPQLRDVQIDDELTEFNIAGNAEAWWTPAGEWNRYEYPYNRTPANQVGTAHSPISFRRDDGLHIAIHEAALVDYAGFWLQRIDGQRFRTRLSPSSEPWKVRRAAPFETPWRTILIADDAPGLYAASDMILSLNEPNKLGDVSWVKPLKYIGIWWSMHLDAASWHSGPKHGATTENTLKYIDFAAKHGFGAVLVEGWNIGWDGNWIGDHGRNFDFAKAYPDFDMDRIAAHARKKGVAIMGHHETAANSGRYAAQMDAGFDYYARHGVPAVKTGYVADAGGVLHQDKDGNDIWDWHDGQYQVRHHQAVIEAAAKRRIAINAHEPVKDTGLRRTWPNMVSREGARGMEYQAWGDPPNPPEHEANLVFTRMLSGPMDFTPGIVSLTGKGGRRIPSTLAKQLANFVVIYSPVQMAADLPEHYDAQPAALDFIKRVPVDWEVTRLLGGAIGDYAVFARQRRGGADWYVGGVTDEAARDFTVDFAFLPTGKRYAATIWRDGAGGGIGGDPFAMTVETKTVTAATKWPVRMAAGGGFAIALSPGR